MQRIRVFLRDTHFVLNDRSPSQITQWITVRWRECKGERARPHLLPLLCISSQRRHSLRRCRMVGHWRNCHWSVSSSTLVSIHLLSYCCIFSGKRFFPYVLAHEIGHALGLQHSKKSDALMYPYYKRVPLDRINLDIDDRCGINWNYGSFLSFYDLAISLPNDWLPLAVGPSNFCLFVWLMSEIVPIHNKSEMMSDSGSLFPLHFLCKMTYTPHFSARNAKHLKSQHSHYQEAAQKWVNWGV